MCQITKEIGTVLITRFMEVITDGNALLLNITRAIRILRKIDTVRELA